MRKLCRIIFSRYFISAVLILAEIALIFYLLFAAYEYSFLALTIITAINAVALITLVNRNANPEYKVSWLVIIMLIPPFGAALYAMFYSRRMSRAEVRRMQKIKENLDTHPTVSDNIVHEIDESFRSLSERSSLARGKAHAIMNDDLLARLYTNTASKYFESGEEMYAAMLSDISQAKRYIFLEYFIIEIGEMWNNILALLEKKVNEGVEVRLIYDDIGCMRSLPSRYDKRLSQKGIKCVRSAPVSPRISTTHNNRNHRKILVVDGLVAYTGGINIADEYINRKKRFGHWKDGGVRIFGDAVAGLLKLFVASWDLLAGKLTDISTYMPDAPENIGDGGFYLPFGSGPSPTYARPVGKNAIMNVINQAQEYVYITTPYLVIDYDLTEALRNAAQRGVDVRIITPAIPDKRLVKVMTKSAYPHLIEAGVLIYEYTPGFIHEKCIVSDDVYAIIGTINLDYRSLAHHYENAVWIYGAPTVLDAKHGFLRTVDASELMNDKNERLSLFEWMLRNLMRIFAPLL